MLLPRPAPDETLNHLAGGWRVFQLRRGHRFSTDDVLTAWAAHRAAPHATRLLDLGAGVGSIGLMLLRLAPPNATVTLLEVQAVSVALARKSVALNQIQQRARVLHADLRQPDALPAQQRFDLITANPPYLPPTRAVASPHPQRAAARLELHGDVFHYCVAAARHLAPGGRFCLCHAAGDGRPPQAIRDAGLTLLSRRLVHFRASQDPMLALHLCGWRGDRLDPAPLTVRDSQGRWTPEFLRVRRVMGVGGQASAAGEGGPAGGGRAP